MTRLEYIAGSSRKFWEARAQGKELTVRWGRIGVRGQTKVHTLSSPAAAKAMLDRLVAQKTKRGYARVAGNKPAPATRAGASRTATTSAGARPPVEAKRKSRSSSSSRMSDAKLHDALKRYFAAYAKHFLEDVSMPAFSVRSDKGVLEIEVEAPDGRQSVRRRAGAYLLLAGEFWGASQTPEGRARLPRMVATISEYPRADNNSWGSFDDFRHDPRVVEGIDAIAAHIAPADATEAILLLRRFYFVDSGFSGHPVHLEREPPANLRAAVERKCKITAPLAKKEVYYPGGVAKVLAAGMPSKDPIERLAFAVALASNTAYLDSGNHLTYFKHVGPPLEDLIREGDGAAFEEALGVAQHFGQKLFHRGAYPEAKRLLDLVADYHVNLAETLRARWECRLVLGDPNAEDDWRAADALGAPRKDSSLGQCMFWSGDVTDRRSVGLSRAARALTALATGGDPCEDRRKGKPPSAAEKKALLARAKELSDAGMAGAAPRIERDLAAARGKKVVQSRGFQADELAARAKLREASGDLQGAFEDFRAARQLRVAGGLPWQIDHYGPDVRRLERMLAPPVEAEGAPDSFDLAWLCDPARTSTEREAAAAKWHAQPWRRFPPEPMAAVGRPFAHHLVRDITRESPDIWKRARAAGFDLGDRLAFAERALRLMDRWVERPDAEALGDALENAAFIAFFPEKNGRLGDPDALLRRERERGPFLEWVATLVAAAALDEDTVLRGLAGEPWSRLRVRFEAHLDSIDPLRDLFDEVRRAGFDGEALAVVMTAYNLLRRNEWSTMAEPKPDFAALGPRLARLDARRLAPALITWTRAYHRVPDPTYERPPRLFAKWLWPFKWVKSVESRDFIGAVGRGELDTKETRPTPQQLKARKACLSWLGR